MDLDEFSQVTRDEIEHFLESDRVRFSDPEALEYSLPMKPDRKRDIRPRSVLPIKEYLEQGGHPVTSSRRILQDLDGYSSKIDAPTEPSRQIGALLSMAADSEDVPVEEWNAQKYSLNFDDNAEKLLDYTRIAFVDRCLEILDGRENSEAAKYLPTHLEKVNENKWEALYTGNYRLKRDEKDVYRFDQNSFQSKEITGAGGKSIELGRSFIRYQLGVNNIREDDDGYLLKAAPEEVEISRAAAEYIKDLEELTPAD